MTSKGLKFGDEYKREVEDYIDVGETKKPGCVRLNVL
jgi:hypothetical protein